MGKLQDKRIELAKLILETTDKTRLEAVEIALLGTPPVSFTAQEIRAMEELADRAERGEDPTFSWSEVKRSALRRTRK
ncbi:MAG: hypothetical protein R2811_06405 [Flavobacteriales bacterium]